MAKMFESASRITLSGTTNTFIPDELLSDMLSRLPMKLVARFRCVCKQWRSLTYDLCFISAHLNRSPGRPQLIDRSVSNTVNFYDFMEDGKIKEYLSENRLGAPCSLSNSVGGLTYAITHGSNGGLNYLLNPMTGDHLEVPKNCLSHTSSGLGFDASTGEYKIVGLFTADTLRTYACEVLTVGSQVWRRYLGEIPCLTVFDPPVFVHGALHWKAWALTPNILTFDIKNEKFGLISVPPNITFISALSIAEAGGNVYALAHKFEEARFEVWMYDSRQWTMRCSISANIYNEVKDLYIIPDLIGIVHEKILIKLKGPETNGTICCYDLQTKTCSKIYHGSYFPFYVHFGSLLCPKKLQSNLQKNQYCFSR